MNQQPNKHQRWKVVVRTPKLRLYTLFDQAVGGGTNDHRWEGMKVKRVDAWRGKYSGEDNMETPKRSFPIGARSGSN
ncbi:hypothetical protein D8674_038768 [Pyrus ussuriensis x Pyrus communis]|uniref:Uncharacterized protein n=1 Tax=Pyrus ussuriensis x Pyrus communis TaxID=2448454 RepID=A0A5N5FRI6_9ROSA|nr:hypothetical protein D8674_038768 [Pyrus ussuriensis x Pyrus communis]